MQTILSDTPTKKTLPGFHLEKTAKLMKLILSRNLLSSPEIDLTVDQWVIMHLIDEHKTLSQQQLGELALKDAPTITRMLDLMETRKLIVRAPDKSDKRKFQIRLTSIGKEKYLTATPIIHSFRSDAYKGLTSEELIHLENMLNTIFNNLTKLN